MKKKPIKHTVILIILFFLPVLFLLFLYPAKHHYNTLEIVNKNVVELPLTQDSTKIQLKNHLTVLGFFGNNPEAMLTPASNLKELVYDKFKGFKKFQIVILVPNEARQQAKRLKQELTKYSELKYWHFVFLDANTIKTVYNSLKTNTPLYPNLAANQVFIIDKDLKQRGRLDDRTKQDFKNQVKHFALLGYNCDQVSVLKNKMSDDLRILFQEIRERRKGNFDSSTRRANDLKQVHEKN